MPRRTAQCRKVETAHRFKVYATPSKPFENKIGLLFDGGMAFWQPGQITIGGRATPFSKAAEASFVARVCHLAIRPATRPCSAADS